MEFYQVHARCRGAETVSDQGLVYTSLKECLRRCRCEGEAAALHKTAAHPENSLPRPVSPVYPDLSNIIQTHVHQALTKQATPQEALSALQSELQTLVSK